MIWLISTERKVVDLHASGSLRQCLSMTMAALRRWSPLTCLTPAPLSPSGLIILESAEGEVETLVRTNHQLEVTAQNRTSKQVYTVEFAAAPSLYVLSNVYVVVEMLVEQESGQASQGS